MKQYKVVTANRKNAEQIMNDMARQGWEVVTVTYWANWKLEVLITFSKEA